MGLRRESAAILRKDASESYAGRSELMYPGHALGVTGDLAGGSKPRFREILRRMGLPEAKTINRTGPPVSFVFGAARQLPDQFAQARRTPPQARIVFRTLP